MRQTTKTISQALLMLSGAFLFQLNVSGASAEEELTFRLDYKANAQHAPIYLANERGYYRDNGIKLTVIPGSGSSDTVRQIGAGAVDCGLVDALVLVQAAEQRVPVRAVAAYFQRTPIAVLSKESKKISEPADLLKGVRLGVNKRSASFQGLLAMLKANDMTIEQLNLVDIGFGIQPLLVDQVDAVVGFAMGMPEEAERAGVPIHELLISDHGVNAYSLMLVCSQKFIDAHPKLVSGFLTSTLKGVTDTIADHDAALDALTKSVDETDRDIEAEVLKRTVSYWSDEKGGHGKQSEQQWKDTVRIAHDLGLVSSAPAVTDIYTNDFIEPR